MSESRVYDFGSPVVPAFLTKLRLLVDDEETNDLIYWDPSGASFHICDGNRLAKEVLPLFFKHNNLSSFIRQLNMYGFRKVNRVDPSMVQKVDTDDMEFRHPYFLRHRPYLISKIQRRPSNNFLYNYNRPSNHYGLSQIVAPSRPLLTVPSPAATNGPVSAVDFMRLSNAVRAMHVNQETLAQQLGLLQSENQLLCGELQELRDRHERQSQLIQTLFSFLSAFAKDTRSQNFHFGSKRKALPMALSGGLPSHSGLKLNLPKDCHLDENSFLQFSRENDLLENSYKLARLDRDTTSGPNQLPALTDSISSPNPSNLVAPRECSSPITALLTANSIQRPTNLSKGISAKSRPKHTYSTSTATGPNKTAAHRLLQSLPSCTNIVDIPQILNDDQLMSTENYLPQDVKTLQSIPDETDSTLAFLTQDAKSPSLDNQCTLESSANVSLAGFDNPLANLNLSRCTTPMSIIRPDSLDICELFGRRDENEPDISIDDLFLTSGALDDASAKETNLDGPKEPGCGTHQLIDVDTSFASHESQTGSLPCQNSDQLNLRDISVVQPQPISPTHLKSSRAPRKSVALETPTVDTMVEGRQDLFGLPWEEPEHSDSCHGGDVERQSDVYPVSQFNVGLLPISSSSDNPIAIPAPSDRLTRRKRSLTDHNFIVGNEIIPAEAAIPFAKVMPSNIQVQFLNPSTLVSVPHTVTAVSTPPHPSSPPVIMSKCQPRLLVPAISSQPTVVRSAPCFVSATSLHPIAIGQPITFSAPMISVPTVQPANTAPVRAPSPRQVTKKKEPVALRRLAPAFKPLAETSKRRQNPMTTTR